MDGSATALPWSATATDFDHHVHQAGPYDMHARPMSQPVGPPRVPAQLLQVCGGDVKPRLTKDQHEILERHFQAQPKPSTTTKKGFADALGVPLDKINNWFQNRRAKVKQDAKKQLNALHLWNASIAQHSQHYLGHGAPVATTLPQFFGPPPVVPSNTEPSPEQAHLQMSVPQSVIGGSNPNLMQTSVPASRDGTFEQYPQATMAPGIVFDAPNFQQTISEQPFLQDMNFGPSFSQDMCSMPEAYDFFLQQPVNCQMPMEPMSNVAAFTPSESASPHTMPSVTSGIEQPSQLEDIKVSIPVDSPHTGLDYSATGHPTPAESVSTWSSTAPTHDMYDHQNLSAPALTLNQDSPLSIDSFDRRESSACATDVPNYASTEHSSSDSESSFKPPSTGLAARRRKPRPANLISSALRSASYSAGMPGSPGANPNAQDQLRRIRSHGIVNSGRISKAPGPLKSPMHANFDAATIASPKFARHAFNSSVSTISTNGPLTATTMPGSLAPPTPLTPHEVNRFPMGHAANGFFPNGSPGGFPHSGEDPIYLDFSSPESKLDLQQMDQLRANMMARHEAAFFHTPPQSAPALQQHFVGLTPPNMQMRGFVPQPQPMGPNHVRRPSLPHGNPILEVQAEWQRTQQPHGAESMQPMFNPSLADGFHPKLQSMPMGPEMGVGYNGADMSMRFMTGPQPIKISDESGFPMHFQNSTPEDYENGARPK